jgi:(2Fe-2S) ferredoxin
VWQSCFGRCTQGPNVLVREILTVAPTLGTGFATAPGPRGVTALYNRIDAVRARRIVEVHVGTGEIVREYIERPGLHPSDPLGSPRKDNEP